MRLQRQGFQDNSSDRINLNDGVVICDRVQIAIRIVRDAITGAEFRGQRNRFFRAEGVTENLAWSVNRDQHGLPAGLDEQVAGIGDAANQNGVGTRGWIVQVYSPSYRNRV